MPRMVYLRQRQVRPLPFNVVEQVNWGDMKRGRQTNLGENRACMCLFRIGMRAEIETLPKNVDVGICHIKSKQPPPFNRVVDVSRSIVRAQTPLQLKNKWMDVLVSPQQHSEEFIVDR